MNLHRIGDLGFISRQQGGPPKAIWVSTERGQRHLGVAQPGQVGTPVTQPGELIVDLQAALVRSSPNERAAVPNELLDGLQAARDADALIFLPNALMPESSGYILGINASKLRTHKAGPPKWWQFWR